MKIGVSRAVVGRVSSLALLLTSLGKTKQIGLEIRYSWFKSKAKKSKKNNMLVNSLKDLPFPLREDFQSLGSPSLIEETDEALLKLATDNCSDILNNNVQIMLDAGMLKDSLVFDVLRNLDINAFATNSSNFDIVCIHGGLVSCLYHLCQNLLCNKAAFPWIGDPDSCPSQLLPLDAYPVSFDALFAQMAIDNDRTGMDGYRVPSDNLRMRFAGLLWAWCIRFVMWHEVGHLLHGHVDYHKKTFGTAFSEVRLSVKPNALFSLMQSLPLLKGYITKKYEIYQARELQADAFAAQITLRALIENPELVYPDFFDIPNTNYPKNLETKVDRLCYAWGAAIGVVFTLFSMLDPRTLENRTHPLPPVRYGTSWVSCYTWIRENKNFSEQNQFDILHSIIAGWKDVDAAFTKWFPSYHGLFKNKEHTIYFEPESKYSKLWTPRKPFKDWPGMVSMT